MNKQKLKIVDYFFILFSLTLCVFSVSVFGKQQKSETVFIKSPKGEFIYDLSAEAEVTVEGVIGNSVIKIQENRAEFISSPCDNQTCVAAGSISKNGEWAACLPNGIFINISAKTKDSDVDITAY